MELKEIVLKMLENWHLVVLMFFIGSFLKLILSAVLKIYEIRAINKDSIKVSLSDDCKILEITSSNLKIDDLKKLKDENILDYTNKAS